MSERHGGTYVTDQQVWTSGLVRLKAIVAGLPGEAAQNLAQLIIRYRTAKAVCAETVAGVDAASACCVCHGQCCMNGKYRINVLDLLACIAGGYSVVPDFAQKPLCPYGSSSGCLMEPELRPADCVMFVCDAIEKKLPQQARLTLVAEEQNQRECISAASALIGQQVGTPLLLWAARQ